MDYKKLKNYGKKALAGLALLTLVGTAHAKKPQPYQSDAIKKEWGYNIVSCRNPNLIDENQYPVIKDNKIFLVGYSRASAGEALARDMAYGNAVNKLGNLTGKNKLTLSGVFPLKHETYRLEKDGEPCYAVHTLVSCPLSNFDKKTQERLKKTSKKNIEQTSEEEKESALAPGERIAGSIKISSDYHKSSEVSKPKTLEYKVTNLSARILDELTDLVGSDKMGKILEMADIGFNGMSMTGEKDNLITGEEAKALYNHIMK